MYILQDPYISDKVFAISCHICSILNGISNIVIGSAPLGEDKNIHFPPNKFNPFTNLLFQSFLLLGSLHPIRRVDAGRTRRTARARAGGGGIQAAVCGGQARWDPAGPTVGVNQARERA